MEPPWSRENDSVVRKNNEVIIRGVSKKESNRKKKQKGSAQENAAGGWCRKASKWGETPELGRTETNI